MIMMMMTTMMMMMIMMMMMTMTVVVQSEAKKLGGSGLGQSAAEEIRARENYRDLLKKVGPSLIVL
jgi:hypothetical protein